MKPATSPPPHINSTESAPSIAFTVEVLGKTLGIFASVKGLESTVDVLEYREGGVNNLVHRLPGQVTYPNLVLAEGLTTKAVEEWFAKTNLGAERHTVTLTLLDHRGNPVRAWAFADAFPVRWAGPVLSASSTQIAAEELELAHGGMTAMEV